MNRGVFVSLIFLVLIGFCVSRVKYEVVFLKDRLKEINEKLEKCDDDFKVYNAEWSYLNDPKRLKILAAKYFPDMRPTENKQVISYDVVISSDLEQNATKAFGSFLDETIAGEMEAQ